MSWLSAVRQWFTAPERPVDLRGVPGTRDPHTLPDPPAVAADQTSAVLIERDGVLTWAVTQMATPAHTIYIDGDDRPYHHVHEHEGAWVYRRM